MRYCPQKKSNRKKSGYTGKTYCFGSIWQAKLRQNKVILAKNCKNITKKAEKFLHPLEEIYIFFVYVKVGQMLY